MFFWCVQEVAELKEEDIISGKLRTAAAGVSGDLSRTLGELQCDERPMSMHAILLRRHGIVLPYVGMNEKQDGGYRHKMY